MMFHNDGTSILTEQDEILVIIGAARKISKVHLFCEKRYCGMRNLFNERTITIQ